MTFLQQQLNRVTADEPGSSGYENLCDVSSQARAKFGIDFRSLLKYIQKTPENQKSAFPLSNTPTEHSLGSL
jgi:hypothetical protein